MIEKKLRVIVISLLFVAIAVIFVLRLVNLQLVNGGTYLEKSQSSVIKKASVPAPRGEILDRNFMPIVTNRSAFQVELNLSAAEDLNAEILDLIRLFGRCDQLYTDTFPVSFSEPYVFDTEMLENEKRRSAFDTFLKRAKTSTSVTADDAMAALVRYYKLGDYSSEEARQIIGVRYEIYLRAEDSYFTFAEDINLACATAVKEHAAELPGVLVDETSVRYYTNEYFASHIIGYVGKIFAEEYQTYKELGYSMNSTVGKEGIEKVFESELKGTPGSRYTVTDAKGATVQLIEDEEPKIGNDVVLTLSTEMQKITEAGLAETIAALKEQNGEDAAKSGAAVFMKIDTGEVLSMASAPTYNLGTYNLDYAVNAANEDKPFLNRAVSGLFPLGSTFKMVTGVAGLEEGIIKPSTVYVCTGIYDYYTDYQPVCFNSRAHGKTTVVTALKVSCNNFFYDVGRQVGIDVLNRYAKLLGFGSKTGIELAGERSGIVAGREYREAQGKLWEPSETLTAVIGQSDNAATPLQMCNYVATIANGGKRLEPHIVKSIRDSQTGEILYETEPKVVSDMDLSETTVKTILEGLQAVTEKGGSAYDGFLGFSEDVVQVGVKTGTAEMPKGQPSALLVGVAPVEDPQIAFAVVIENGGLNASTLLSQCVREVLTYYFSDLGGEDTVLPEKELLD